MFKPKTGKEIGDTAEDQAKAYLEHNGMKLIIRNYRCPRGEIDLIMNQGNTLVFVEVRYRKSDTFGSAAESVTATKRRRIITAASHYLTRHKQSTKACRFDVVAISGNTNQQIEWIEDAFQLD